MLTVRPARGLRVAAGLVAVAAGLAACAQPSAPVAAPVRSTAPVASPVASATATTAGPTSPTAAPPTPTAARSTSAPSPAPPAGPGRLAPVPLAGREPTVRFPRNPPAVGSGANATVSAIPDAVWSAMVGYSWTQGCPVGRASLKYVQVNFWGFDGVRSRGALVVNTSIAQATARAFTRLYDQQFRIRQMRPMDSSWGKNPKGPGADDYAAMAADNTSAFNCRYVGGQEASKVYSKHAYGTAIDVNDFENPYVADNGTVYPDDYFLNRRGPRPGVLSAATSAAVRAFTDQGLRWGGLWANPDYQHFDR